VIDDAKRQTTATHRPSLIVTSEWWSDWALRYLAGRQEHIHVATWDEYMAEHVVTDGQRVWFVEFADSKGLAMVRGHLAAKNREFQEFAILYYTGRHAMYVLATRDAGIHNAQLDDVSKQHWSMQKNYWYFWDFLKLKIDKPTS
jgi:hypothetical protein